MSMPCFDWHWQEIDGSVSFPHSPIDSSSGVQRKNIRRYCAWSALARAHLHHLNPSPQDQESSHPKDETSFQSFESERPRSVFGRVAIQWDVFTKFRAKLPAGRTDWRAFQLAFILYGGRRLRKFGGLVWKEKRAIMLCHRFWVFPGCSTKTDLCKFELVPATTACFRRSIYGLTLEARQACRRQSKQRRSVSFHHPPADASLQKQWLVAIPLTNTPTSSKRMPMFAESTSSGDVDRVVFQP